MATGIFLGFASACGGGGGGGVVLTPGTVDITVDAGEVARTLAISTEFFAPDDCAIVEGLVPTPGARRLLRFSTSIANYGALDLVVGDPTNPIPPLVALDFQLSPCHGHRHFEGWAEYSLEDELGQVVGSGHKQAFCLRDSSQFFGPATTYDFTCEFQGISSGHHDLYASHLDGQWIDITEVPAGSYVLVVTANAAEKIVEVDDRYPNTVRVPVVIPP